MTSRGKRTIGTVKEENTRSCFNGTRCTRHTRSADEAIRDTFQGKEQNASAVGTDFGVSGVAVDKR